jgi:hypothetical protein
VAGTLGALLAVGMVLLAGAVVVLAVAGARVVAVDIWVVGAVSLAAALPHPASSNEAHAASRRRFTVGIL